MIIKKKFTHLYKGSISFIHNFSCLLTFPSSNSTSFNSNSQMATAAITSAACCCRFKNVFTCKYNLTIIRINGYNCYKKLASLLSKTIRYG